MPSAAFATLGCKVNQYETQRILDDFEARGFAITEFNQPADVYVINSCSVTQAAERKSRQMARKASRQSPGALVVLTGCFGEMAGIRGEEIDEAAIVVPNREKLQTLSHLLRAYPRLETDLQTQPKPVVRPPARRTRATIKVQDGCNVFCAFCSIPQTRSSMVSRPMDELVAEAERLAASGCREIVITGVLVGAYGQDGFVPTPVGEVAFGQDGQDETGWEKSRPDLADLLLQLAETPGLQRVRLSSIEPTQVTNRLLDAFASQPKLCRHLHIPLQSGDSAVLAAMNRPYDQAFYLDRCREAHARIPDLAITSDIMVGFPGEDRAAFESTLCVAREACFARSHLFRYSPRPNTPAATLPDQVPDAVKEERAKELAALCAVTQQRFIRRFIGRELEVLVEGKERSDDRMEPGRDDGRERAAALRSAETRLLSGYTSNYIRVQLTGGSHLVGRVARVRLLEPASDGAIGEVVFGQDEQDERDERDERDEQDGQDGGDGDDS